MSESTELIKIGDIVTIHSQVRGILLIISSKSYIPSSATLSPLSSIESYESFFRIQRPKLMISEEYPNPDDDTLNYQSEYESQKQNIINFDEPIIFIHLMSGRYLSAKESDGQHINLIVTEDYQRECEFKLMPMFRCQTLGSKRVRQGEEVVLRSLNFEENQGNYNLGVVSLGEKIASIGNKADIFSIKINKRGFFDNQNQLYYRKLYKINNIQIDRNIIVAKNIVTFFQAQNQLETMFYCLKIKDPNSFTPIEQNESIYIKSVRYDTFIELHGGEFRVTDKASKACQFRLVEYRIPEPHVLTKEAVLTLLHFDSGRYLSFEFEHQKGDFVSKPSSKFQLKDTIQLVPVLDSSIRQCFFISQFKQFLQKFSQMNFQTPDITTELSQLKNVLFEMLIFLFEETKIACQIVITKFFELEPMKTCTNENHTLFKQWNIGSAIFKTIEIVVNDYRKLSAQMKVVSEGKRSKKPLQKDDILERIELNSNIIKIMYVLIVGMCKNNLKNTKLFLKFNSCVFSHMDLDLGAIECIIHIFKDNKQFLRLLQGSPEQSKNDKSYMHLIINHIRKIPRSKISLAIKTAQLLKCLVIAHSDAVKMNQTIVGEQFSVNKLQQVLFSRMYCDDGELRVIMFQDPEEEQEIIEMYIKKNKYNSQLVLVEKLLLLYASLCAGRNYLNLQFIRQKLPLKTILKYINSYSIQGSLKNCFLTILLHTYLDSLPRTLHAQNNIICIEHGRKQTTYQSHQITDRLLNKDYSMEVQMKQVSSYKYDTELNDIKQQLMKDIVQQLSTRKFTESTHMIMEILYNYLTFNMFNHQERSQLKTILTEFVCSDAKISGEFRQKIYFTTIKILHKFEEYSQEQNSKSMVLQLISNPKRINDLDGLFQGVIAKRRVEDSKNNKLLNILFSFCQEFRQTNNNNFVDLALDTIKKRMLPKRQMIKNLKSVLIIQQSQILSVYNKLKNQTILDIELQIEKLSISIIRMDKSLMYESVRKLNQAIQDIAVRFTMDDEQFNKRYQFMLKQLGIHKIILSFLIESINDLKLDILTDTTKVYKSAFKFLAQFIENNQTNTKIIVRSINDLKKYILFPEMGQSHFFLMLTKNQDIKFMIEESIVPIVLENLPNNVYLTCIMLEYCKKQNIINTKFIDKLSKRFLTDQSLFANILMMKKNRGVADLALGERRINQLIYYTQLFRLLNMMFQYTTDKKYLIEMSKRYITLQIILRALNQNDIFEERTDTALVFTLLEKQLIRCLRLLKLHETKFKKENEDLIQAFFQKSLKKVHFYSQQTQNQQSNYISGFMQNQLTELYDILLLTEDFKKSSDTFDKNIHFVYYLTSLLGPLIGDMLYRYLENQSGQLNELSKKQMQILQENFSHKLKETVYDLLTKYDYDKFTNDFSKAISRCEQVFKIKIKLGFTGIRERKETLLAEEQTDDVIKNTRLQLVLHFFTQGSDKEKKLYKSIFDILQGDEATTLVTQQRQHLSKLILQTLQDQSGMIDLLSFLYTDKLNNGDFDKFEDRKNIRNIIMFIRLILFNSDTKQVQLMFINNKVPEATIRWCSESTCDISIHSKVIVLLSELLVSKNKQNKEAQDKVISILKQLDPTNQFFQKFKSILKDEKLIYSNLIFSQKRRDKVTSQKQLSYENNALSPNSLSLTLTFIQSLIQGSSTSNKQYIGTQLGFFQIIISLLRSMIKYSLSFSENHKAYYSLSTHYHISSLVQTMYHFINYQSTSNIQILIERNLISVMMDILAMNDHVKFQQSTYSKSPFERLEELMLNCPQQPEKKHLRQIHSISKASIKLYKQLPKFLNPFLPTLPNYLRIKTAVIKILSQLIHLQNKHQQTIIFKSLSESTIKTNIMNIYSKHLIIYNKTYEIFAFYNKSRIYNDPQIMKTSFKKLVEQSNYIENGFMLVYILRKTESHRQQIDKEIEELKRKKVSNRTYMEPIREVIDFSRDCTSLIKGCFSCFQKVDTKISQQDEGISNAIRFFLQKSGRIEILKNQTLYAIDFPRLPQCVRKIELETQYLDQIDLTSVQSKSDSILKYSSRFILLYDNEQRYKVQYKSLPFIDILLQHMNLFRNISFIIIIVLNLLILINKRDDISSPNYTKQFTLFYAFIVLQMCITYMLFLFFLLKQMPLIILQINKAIEIRRNTYGSNFNTYPLIVRISIRVWMFIAQPQLLYHLLFTIFVTVSFFYPVFVSILLLDIFIRIPLLRRILMAIWRPKVEIILALVAFILIEYYFSILLYFSFQGQTYGYCTNLQDCFSFVYFVTYKVVGGFPGFLFQYKQGGQTNFQVSGFSVFQDIYIIITFEIFFAVLIGIIIDNFTILRTEEDEKRNHLENYCLICGVNKAVINESNTKTNFRKHIREDHNIWNYFYFFTYIHKKPRHQRSELEEYMAVSLENKSTEWLPLNYMSHLHLKN